MYLVQSFCSSFEVIRNNWVIVSPFLYRYYKCGDFFCLDLDRNLYRTHPLSPSLR